MPTPTDLVTDLPADFEVFGQAVDTSLADLKGGTSGQILAKNSNTDMDFVWIANDQGDITGITASSPLTGGGTSGAVTIGILSGTTSNLGAVQLSDSTSSTSTTLAATANAVKTTYDLANAAIPKSLIDAAGDLIVGTAADTAGRLAIGTANQILAVNSGATALEWKTPASTGFAGARLYNSTSLTLANNTATEVTFNSELYDTDGFHSTSTNTARITVPAGKAGYYYVYANVEYGNSATGGRETQIRKNGAATDGATTYQNFSGGDFSMQTSCLLYLAEGDYVSLYAYQNSGGNLTLYLAKDYQQFSAMYLGA